MIHTNNGEMYDNHNARIPGYNNKVWFSRIAIASIISLNKLNKKYRVTYDRTYKVFIVNREEASLPIMEFIMRDLGLSYYEPPNKYLLFLNTVYKNKGSFIKIQIKEAVKTRELHHTLGFTTVKEVKWIIRSNQIQYFPVNIEDVDNDEMT